MTHTTGVYWYTRAFVSSNPALPSQSDYDALSLSPVEVSPPSFHTTVFPVSDQNILTTAEKLVNKLRARHYYTDTATFDLRCGTCGEGLKGETGAREHAMKTGRKSLARLDGRDLADLRRGFWRVLTAHDQ